MIPLPSGKVAGISNIRARYHAMRLNREVRTDTTHRDLYGFVDIVVKPERVKSIPYQPSFLFSGHTLADLPQTLWSASDRKAFDAWIQQEQQIREIEQVRKRVTGDEFRLTEREYDYPKTTLQLFAAKAGAGIDESCFAGTVAANSVEHDPIRYPRGRDNLVRPDTISGEYGKGDHHPLPGNSSWDSWISRSSA